MLSTLTVTQWLSWGENDTEKRWRHVHVVGSNITDTNTPNNTRKELKLKELFWSVDANWLKAIIGEWKLSSYGPCKLSELNCCESNRDESLWKSLRSCLFKTQIHLVRGKDHVMAFLVLKNVSLSLLAAVCLAVMSSSWPQVSTHIVHAIWTWYGMFLEILRWYKCYISVLCKKKTLVSAPWQAEVHSVPLGFPANNNWQVIVHLLL